MAEYITLSERSRTGLELGSMLKDKIVYSEKQEDSITFAQGFGGITDIQVGPDGYLHALFVVRRR